MRGKLIVVTCLIAALTLTLAAAGFWEKKPYTQWSEKDARKMLEKSPWCYEFNWGRQSNIGSDVTGPPLGTMSPPTSTPADDSRGHHRRRAGIHHHRAGDAVLLPAHPPGLRHPHRQRGQDPAGKTEGFCRARLRRRDRHRLGGRLQAERRDVGVRPGPPAPISGGGRVGQRHLPGQQQRQEGIHQGFHPADQRRNRREVRFPADDARRHPISSPLPTRRSGSRRASSR